MTPLLSVRDLQVSYGQGRARLTALEGIDLDVAPGESVGIVGESGSGKSTLARAILQLVPATGGRVTFGGEALNGRDGAALSSLRRRVSVVFQDPVASLDPKFTVAESVAEPLEVHEPALEADGRARKVAAMLERVGLSSALSARYPHELSGGQCQRVAIARAMITRPRLLVCDEPSSALDVSVQAQIANLFLEFQREEGTALLVISHNLALVRRLCSRILVLYLGRVMELGSRSALYEAPLHPYTRLLLDSVPGAGRIGGSAAAGEPASPFAPPSGCVFRTRGRHALERCALERPPLTEPAPGHLVACIRSGEGVGALPSRAP